MTPEKPTGEVFFAELPGPTRKRTPTPYRYRLTYRNNDKKERGCVFLWDVMGGRDVYQVALERETDGGLRWHCTCPDAAYRGESRPTGCKHVRALQTLGRPCEGKASGPCKGAEVAA